MLERYFKFKILNPKSFEHQEIPTQHVYSFNMKQHIYEFEIQAREL